MKMSKEERLKLLEENLLNCLCCFRGLKKDTKKEYIYGNYVFANNHHTIVRFDTNILNFEEIEYDTLSIWYNNGKMLNKQNKPVFASLNKTGKGGDIIKMNTSLNRFLRISFNVKNESIPKFLFSPVIISEDGSTYFKGMFGWEGQECSLKDIICKGIQKEDFYIQKTEQ